MRTFLEFVYLLHFGSIATLMVGGFRMLGEVKGARGYDVNPNFAKRVLTHKRAIGLGMWGILATGLLLLLGGVEFGFLGGRIPFLRRPLPPGLLIAYIIVLSLIAVAAFHPMVAITYRLVPTILARPGNLAPEEADGLVRRLRLNARLLVILVVVVLAGGAFRWLYSAGVLS
jgi:hypothetical protein